MKIAYLDMIFDETEIFEELVIELRKHVSDDTVIDYHYVTGTDNLEYMAFEVLVLRDLLFKIGDLRTQGYDAVIIGCFFDPVLDAAKELYDDIIIVGAGESAILTALKLGKTFSVIAARRKHFPKMLENIERIGVKSRLASLRSLDIKVSELQQDHTLLSKRMGEEISSAVSEDLAEVIVLGCTMETGQYKHLQETYHVPIIDPTVAALMQARMEFDCRKHCNWKYSRVCAYEQPPADEVKKFLKINL